MIHPLLNAALVCMPTAESYRQTAHLGGSMPTVPRRAHVRIARWCAGFAAPFAQAPMATRVEELLMEVDALDVADDEAGKREIVRAIEAIEVQALNLPEVADYAPVRRLFLSARDEATAIVLDAARLTLGGSPRHVGRRSCVVAASTAALLAAKDPARAALFVAALDEQLLLAELAWVARDRIPHLAERISAIELRMSDRSGTPRLWLVRMGDGFGALVRDRGVRWIEGPTDVVLANVPAEHRADAAERVGQTQRPAR